jgi:hypothetical protein
MKISVDELRVIQERAGRDAIWPWKKLLAELRGCAEVVVNHHEMETENAAMWKQLRDSIAKANFFDRGNP